MSAQDRADERFGPHRLTYTVPEVALVLGVSQSLVWTLIRQGALPVVRLRKRVLVNRAGLEQAVAHLAAKEQGRSERLRVMR